MNIMPIRPLYINADQAAELFDKWRQQGFPPNLDSATRDKLLSRIVQLLRQDYPLNILAWDAFSVGGCETCRWRNRRQKCSCCRRNRHLKDCWEEER